MPLDISHEAGASRVQENIMIILSSKVRIKKIVSLILISNILNKFIMLEQYSQITNFLNNKVKEFQLQKSTFGVTLLNFYPIPKIKNIEKKYQEGMTLIEIGKKDLIEFYIDFAENGLIKYIYPDEDIEILNQSLDNFLFFIKKMHSFDKYHDNMLKKYNFNFLYEDFEEYLTVYIDTKKELVKCDEKAMFNPYWANYFFPNITGFLDELIYTFLEKNKNTIPLNFVDYLLIEKIGQIGTTQEIFKNLEENRESYYNQFFDINSSVYKSLDDSLTRLNEVFYGKNYQEKGLEKLKAIGFNPDYLKK